MKIGQLAKLFSSVGSQLVTIVETGLTLESPLAGRCEDMVTVKYSNGGVGFAHPRQLELMGIHAEGNEARIARAEGYASAYCDARGMRDDKKTWSGVRAGYLQALSDLKDIQ